MNRLTLSLSLANACNPYYEHPLVRDNTSRISLLCSILRQPIWAGARSDKIHWSARLRVPRGSKRRQVGQSLCQVKKEGLCNHRMVKVVA
jgi:hypothetical protein